ncbi:Y4jA/Y4nE/Y4sE (plasmid) [Methylobacterium phyllosphaerae]|uniref:Y4jA/Y4nE/Y4sE n=1 Tax=Methylobacterium phyllosphaerae TaxID=418223 RepID=A0AAE8HYB5_9HYPH|nr:Y4jA/Y4nE/Y4sE [Methylobacterium phyllosphaerae]SFH74818.1 hypothetical protein SAMN05192567_15411 [Methylobacterium phyllosphaerae]
MPGRHVTDHQMRLFMQFRQSNSVAAAAAKATFSPATGHRISADPRLPSAKKAQAADDGPILSPRCLRPRSCHCSRPRPA